MRLETWLAFTTRDFTPKERQNLIDRKYMPRAIPIAYDGLAIIVNNANPDSCITVNDFARVLKGEVSKWNELYPQSKLGEIDVVFDNPLSSTVRWCVDSILGGKQFSAKNIGAVQTSAAVIDYVEKHNGNYPLRRTIYALLNDTRNGVPSGFTHFIQLPRGQKIILRAGLLPRTANMNVRDVIVNRQ